MVIYWGKLLWLLIEVIYNGLIIEVSYYGLIIEVSCYGY